MATYVKVGREVGRVQPPALNMEDSAISVRLKIHNGNMDIINVYYPEGVGEPSRTEWVRDVVVGHDEWLVVGDFNAHHADWGGVGTPTTGGGQFLSSNIEQSPFVLLNDGSVTRMPERADHRPSSIDLSLITPDIEHITSCEVLADDLGSDHLPIIITIGVGCSSQASDESIDLGYNYDKADLHLLYSVNLSQSESLR